MKRAKKVPVSRVGRLARLARVGASTGASLVLSGSGDRAARQAAQVLGTLRGLAAKVGQMASYVDGMVPATHRESYEAALRSLRAAAPTSSAREIRLVVEAELGSPIDHLFAEWQDEPIASASIGQVHRARLTDGREVAVKVQHPGIDRAVESDLANAAVIRSMIGALGPQNIDSRRIFEEIRTRFREELDYRLEAEQQSFFRELHSRDPHIQIPAVVEERSAKRVLTTELVSGRDLDEAALAPETDRRAWSETLWRFVFKGNLVGGRFNADPHPGNFFFGEDGRVTFIDFGCVQPIVGRRLDLARTLHFAALSGDELAFAETCRQILETSGGAYERDAVAYSRRCFEPLFSAPYRITRAYVTSLVEGVRDMKHHMLEEDSGFVQLPEGMLFMNRLQFGFYSVLARLNAEVDYRAVEREFLAGLGPTEPPPAARQRERRAAPVT